MKDAGPAGHRACVLIVEDDDDVREFMQLLVSTAGYETMTARDGQDALVKMRQRRPCIVLLDLQMPRMDGWDSGPGRCRICPSAISQWSV